ncbi:dihydropteroate synthase [Desulfosarcina variabilis str. Montpellier]|uniref:dihydropteroate synthase n=1 Tax=Desulfosarcina variabilis TaxID=2300 RepID=UPI003AFB1487
MIVIGEKINGTRKAVWAAIRDRDAAFIKALATSQVDVGCDYLDVNAGTSPEREPDDLAWLIETVQSVTDVPLCLDSANPNALKAGLAQVDKTPIINSVSGEKKRIEGVLPLALEYKTSLILLALDDTHGIPDDSMREVSGAYPEAHITCGLSNISFGMPLRSLINQTFICMCIQMGLDSAIIDPNDRSLMGVMLAAEMLVGKDRYCQRFTRAFRSNRIGTTDCINT